MKMKYKLYIVIFMVMCILPFAGMAVAKTETTTENRTMAAFPSFYGRRKVECKLPAGLRSIL